MFNTVEVNYDSIIASLKQKRDALLKEIQQVDQAIASLGKIPGVNPGGLSLPNAFAFEMQPTFSSVVSTAIKQLDSSAKSDAYPFQLKEEIAGLVEAMTGEISQPLIFKAIIEKYPEIAERAKESQLGARIAGELRKLEERKVLVLVKKSVSNFPNIYRKASELSEVEKHQIAHSISPTSEAFAEITKNIK